MEKKMPKMTIKNSAKLLAGLSLLASSAAQADQLLSADEVRNIIGDEVTIDVVAAAGSGCPSGTVSSVIAPDGKSFILGFDEYLAEAGPNIPLSQGRKFCNLAIVLNVPNGVSYTIADVNYRGYAYLEAGVEAMQKSTYFFAGNIEQASMRSGFKGPYDDDYVVGDSVGFNSVLWSECSGQQPVSIKTEVRVNNMFNRSASGIITTDTIDGRLTHQYGLRFRECS
jgi:hypothetical protein